MGWVWAALAIGGAIFNAVGNVKSGNAAKRVGEYNAAAAELMAQDAEQRGVIDAARQRSFTRMTVGSQRAGFAGQNVEVGSGSAADVQADAAYLGTRDEMTIRANAAREAWGFRVEAENARLGGEYAKSASRWGAASTLLGTGASLLQTRYGRR